jgi:hypothetical protein
VGQPPLTDQEQRQLFSLLRRFCEGHIDPPAHLSMATNTGTFYIDLGRVPPPAPFFPELYRQVPAPFLPAPPRRRALAIGDRVRVYGGYDQEPEWLAANANGYFGCVIGFIPGQNEPPAPVVELDEELVVTLADSQGKNPREVHGSFIVLELGHRGTDWATTTPRIHVELCDFRPEVRPYDERRKGVWAESHATYEIVD